jgi:hypothetical protein
MSGRSSTNISGSHDIAELILKVTSYNKHTINPNPISPCSFQAILVILVNLEVASSLQSYITSSYQHGSYLALHIKL